MCQRRNNEKKKKFMRRMKGRKKIESIDEVITTMVPLFGNDKILCSNPNPCSFFEKKCRG